MKYRATFLFTLLILIGRNMSGRIKITNIKCISFDESLLRFRTCNLKVVGRGVVAAFIYLENYARDEFNLTYNFAFFKKANTYKPFLYNMSGDFCVMVKTFKKNPIFKLIYDSVPIPREYIHPCPFNHDLNFTNFVIDPEFLNVLPVPNGDYLLTMKWGFNKVWKIQINGYTTISDTNTHDEKQHF